VFDGEGMKICKLFLKILHACQEFVDLYPAIPKISTNKCQDRPVHAAPELFLLLHKYHNTGTVRMTPSRQLGADFYYPDRGLFRRSLWRHVIRMHTMDTKISTTQTAIELHHLQK
jgi:hypothetical protein